VSLSPRVAEIITELELRPHPEGGWFRETYRSEMKVRSPQAGAERSAITDIHFLLSGGEISRFHRVLHDEIWNYCEGAPLILHLAVPDGAFTGSVTLGSRGEGRALKHVVPAGHWQAAETAGEYTLVSCAVAPGFDFADFGFLRDAAEQSAKLRQSAPDLARLV